MISQFPLSKPTRAQHQGLARALWSWNICAECLAGKQCEPPICPWYRSTSLQPFFQFYEEESCSYRTDVTPGQSPSVSSHEDLFGLIEKIKSSPDVTRAQLLEKLFMDRPVRSDQERVIDLAIRVMFMVNCSTPRQDSVLVEAGVHQAPWRRDMTLAEYINSLFVKRPISNIGQVTESLRGVKLKKLGLKFEPADDIRSHLKFDRKKAVVTIFHHAAFLKEQLRLTISQSADGPVSDSIKLGALPRELALETLNSTQTLLFPLTDSNSKALLKSLTVNEEFDQDILRYDFGTVCNPDERNAIYQYFTAELGDLYDEQTTPTLKGAQKWWEKKSGARYVMMVTVAGITFAFLSLGLAAFQVWIGWQQWRHPIREND